MSDAYNAAKLEVKKLDRRILQLGDEFSKLAASGEKVESRLV